MSEKQQVKEKKEKKRGIIGKVLLVILVILLMLLAFQCGSYQKPQDDGFETKVNEITEMEKEDRQAAVNTIVEEGKININFLPKTVFEGKTSVMFNVKNIENNHGPIEFEIFDENGESIYRSKKIAPGYEMKSIELEKELEKGMHECRIKIGYSDTGNVVSTFPLSIEVR